MNSLDYDNWKFIRGKGKTRYVVETGVLQKGLPVGVLFSILNTWFDDQNVLFFLHKTFWLTTLMYIAGCSLLSIISGLISWRSQERKYKQYQSENHIED